MNTNLTRRGVVKTVTVTVAAAVLLPSLLWAAPQRPIKKAIMINNLGFTESHYAVRILPGRGHTIDLTAPATLEERFKAMKITGFDGVELVSHMNQDEVVKALEASGLKAAGVYCSTHWKDRLSDPNPEVRAKGLEGLRQSLRDAKRYGASSVLLVPGEVKRKTTYDECWKRSIEQIRLAIPLAEELGVKIAIENVWNNFITTPEQAVKYLDEINSPMVGWHFDIGNAIRYGPPERWIALLGKRIVKVHFKEYGKAKGFDVGFFQGDNNWPAIMKALDSVGYQDWAIAEMPLKQTSSWRPLKWFSETMDMIIASE